VSKIEPRDAAQLVTMDYILNQGDRHAANVMVGMDENGRARLGIIDSGLIGGGRIRAGENVQVTEAELEQYALEEAGKSITDYAQQKNNAIKGISSRTYVQRPWQLQSAEDRQIFREQAMKTIDTIEENLDQILSIQRIEANGIRLTPVEKAHIEAIRTVAVARIAMMRNGGISDLMVFF
jgi:hypothetical protein